VIKPILLITTAAILVFVEIVSSQEPSPEADLYTKSKMVLHPMPESKPALKYPLLPPKLEQRPGNAALEYQRIEATYPSLFSGKEFEEKFYGYQELPLADLRADPIRKELANYSDVIRDMQRAARCRSCDWQTPYESMLADLPMAEMMQMRRYVWVLTAAARLQIADGKFDEALRNLQTGYAMARHINQGGTPMHAYFGAALIAMVEKTTEDWIRQPAAPNLYWNLTALPRPMIDFQPAMELEKEAVRVSFPDMYDPEAKRPSAEQWQKRLKLLCHSMQNNYFGFTREDYSNYSFEPCVVGLTSYPSAKRFLVEHGFNTVEVDAMPVAQVILLAVVRNDDAWRDEIFKWMPLTPQDVEEHVFKKSLPGEILPLARSQVLTVLDAKIIELRMDRDLQMLRVVEALRIYAASHNGRLPDRLEDITEVPVPQDPLHGRPFIYRRTGDAARLESPPPKTGSWFLGRLFIIQRAPKGK
jgi:hypothetical protein